MRNLFYSISPQQQCHSQISWHICKCFKAIEYHFLDDLDNLIGFVEFLGVGVVINIICFIVAVVALHYTGQRMSSYALQYLHNTLSTDRFILYSLFVTATLLCSFHVLGVIALLSGLDLVHITSLTMILIMVWFIVGFLLAPKRERGDYRTLNRVPGKVLSLLPKDCLVRWIILIVVSLYSIFIFEAATRPPTGWDGVEYHLPLAAKWLQNGNLSGLMESWKFAMPSNGELILLFFMYLKENRIISLVFLPFVILGTILVYSLSRRLGISRELSIVAGVTYATIPIVLFNAFAAYIDLFGSVFIMCSVYFGLWWIQNRTRQESTQSDFVFLGLAGLSCGIAVGTKYPFLLAMAVILFLLSFYIFVDKRKLQLSWARGKKAVRGGLTFCSWTIILSIFWYLRNMIEVGNPLYPLRFTLKEGHLVATGFLGNALEYRDWSPLVRCSYELASFLLLPWTECHYSGNSFSINSGFGPIFGTFIVFGLLASLGIIIWRFFHEGDLSLVVFPFMSSVLFLVVWWEFVHSHMIRMTLHSVGLFIVFMGLGLSLLSGRRLYLAKVLVLCTCVLNMILLMIQPLTDLGGRVLRNQWSHSAYYNVPEVINNLPPQSIILNAANETKNYALFGKHLQNRVIVQRVLFEPVLVTIITNDFIRRKNIDYVYYASNTKSRLENREDYRLIAHQKIKNSKTSYEVFLYQTNHSFAER